MNKSDSNACKRLSEQIKFFGAKPKRFVSIYAKKPRIRVNTGQEVTNQSASDLLKAKHKLLSNNSGAGQLEEQRLREAYLRSGLSGLAGYNGASQHAGMSNIGQCGGLGLELGVGAGFW